MNNKRAQLTNEILVLQSQAGQADAFRKLVQHWQKRLWGHAFSITRNGDVSWDLVQDTWVKVIRSLPHLQDPAAFPGWVLRITNNLAIDWVRREIRKRQTHADYAHTLSSRTTPDEFTFQRVGEAMSKLCLKDHALLSFFYFEDLSLNEISATLNIPIGTVKSRLHYARAKLKSFLEAAL